MEGIVKLLLAGADVSMMASVLLLKGPAYLGELLDQVRRWLEEHDYSSIEQLKGSMSQQNCPDPSTLERANYMQTLTTYTWQQPVPDQD